MSNDKYMKELDMLGGLLIGVFVIGLLTMVALVFIASNSHDKNKNNCEKLGGNYEVVDQGFNGRHAVDIYGCVK